MPLSICVLDMCVYMYTYIYIYIYFCLYSSMEKGYTYGTAPQKREWELGLSFKTLKICGVN